MGAWLPRRTYHEVGLLTKGKMLQQQGKELIFLLSQVLLQSDVHFFHFAPQLMHEPGTFGSIRRDGRLDQLL